MTRLVIQNATILTMNRSLDVVEGSVVVEAGRIVQVGGDADGRGAAVIDAHGGWLLPGFVQTHVHLCQTLFRGYADDRPLLEWLRQRVWPMEAAHTPASLRASARLASAELLLSGTTCALTMETVHDTDAVVEAVAGMGLRATIGKCMMDGGGDGPSRLREDTRRSLDESLSLHARWHGRADGRIRIALAPRFAVSCTQELLELVAGASEERGALVHTHASESRAEVDLVRQQTGLGNMAYFGRVGLASPRLCAAHCIWVDDSERQIMAERGVKALHCPGSNLKLGSGVAPVVDLLARGITVSLGADGAACNNRLDMFDEMRLAATLQALRSGPGSLSASRVMRMATIDGAATLGLDHEIGSVEPGKRADLVVVDRDRPHLVGAVDPYSALVYSARGTDVRTVVVDGELLVDGFTLADADLAEIGHDAAREAAALARRAGL